VTVAALSHPTNNESSCVLAIFHCVGPYLWGGGCGFKSSPEIVAASQIMAVGIRRAVYWGAVSEFIWCHNSNSRCCQMQYIENLLFTIYGREHVISRKIVNLSAVFRLDRGGFLHISYHRLIPYKGIWVFAKITALPSGRTLSQTLILYSRFFCCFSSRHVLQTVASVDSLVQPLQLYPRALAHLWRTNPAVSLGSVSAIAAWHHFRKTLIPCLHAIQAGWRTGFTTGWMLVYTMQPVVQPVVQPVWQPFV